jgi:hypothetical protein
VSNSFGRSSKSAPAQRRGVIFLKLALRGEETEESVLIDPDYSD